MKIIFILSILLNIGFSGGDHVDISFETNISHSYEIQTIHIHSNGYEFILYGAKPGSYLDTFADDEREITYENILFENDSFVLVKMGRDFIYYLPESENTAYKDVNNWATFKNAESKHFLSSEKYPKYDVAIFEYTGGARCCGYIHLFTTKNEFKYLGRHKAFY
jgi:hypothetical protein